MQYFTSDLHLHHPFVAALRGYALPRYAHLTAQELRAQSHAEHRDMATMVDIHAHDRAVIEAIDARVGEDDDLYVLGDISSGGQKSLGSALAQLAQLRVPREKRHLILGNHEELEPDDAYLARLGTVFGSVELRGSAQLDGLDAPVVLSHFQFAQHFDADDVTGMSANARSPKYGRHAFADDGATILLHGHTHAAEPFEFGNPREVNVGVDAWHMAPVSERELVELLKTAPAGDADGLGLSDPSKSDGKTTMALPADAASAGAPRRSGPGTSETPKPGQGEASSSAAPQIAASSRTPRATRRRPTLTILRGLPASGKSTWARSQAGARTVIVNLDGLRRMMLGSLHAWQQQADARTRRLMLRAARTMIADALRKGFDVISDAQHADPAFVREEVAIALDCGAEVKVRDFTDLSLETLLERNAARDEDDRVPERYLRAQFARWKDVLATPVDVDAVVAEVAPTLRRGKRAAAAPSTARGMTARSATGSDGDVPGPGDAAAQGASGSDGDAATSSAAGAPNLLEAMRANPNVRVKPVEGEPGLFACNFTSQAFLKHRWDGYSSKARGLFLDADGRVVMRGFEKFFNLGENLETSLERVLTRMTYPVRVERKENGFLGLVGATDTAFRFFSKSGVTDYSPLVERLVRAALGEHADELHTIMRAHDVTLAFEIVDVESDRHIIAYPRSRAVFLHAIRNDVDFAVDAEADAQVDALGVFARPSSYVVQDEPSLLAALRDAQASEREGAVFYGADGYMVKVKSDLYLKSKSLRTALEKVLLQGAAVPTDASEKSAMVREVLRDVPRGRLLYRSEAFDEPRVDMTAVTQWLMGD